MAPFYGWVSTASRLEPQLEKDNSMIGMDRLKHIVIFSKLPQKDVKNLCLKYQFLLMNTVLKIKSKDLQPKHLLQERNK